LPISKGIQVKHLRQMSISSLTCRLRQPTELYSLHIYTKAGLFIYFYCGIYKKEKSYSIGLFDIAYAKRIHQENKTGVRPERKTLCLIKPWHPKDIQESRNQDWDALSRLFAASFIFPTKS